MSGPRVVIVHERFTELGGSERVVENIFRMWPDARVRAGLVDPAAVPPGLAAASIQPSRLQRLYRGGRDYCHLLPLLPGAFASLDVGDADLVITSHHAFANRVRVPDGVPVLSYTHTPARWMWDPQLLANEPGGWAGRAALAGFGRTQRGPDVAAARRLRVVVVNSHHVAQRVMRWWGLSSTVVPPPVDVHWYSPAPDRQREDFFLLAGRLVPYKRPDVAVAAAMRAGVRLVVAGEGRMRSCLEAEAGPGVEFLGHVSDVTLRDLYRRCQALLFPGEEDFGMVPVEAQACGAPVIARRIGGVIDTVVDGVTGDLYDVGAPGEEVDALVSALLAFEPGRFDTGVIRARAERFSPEAFASRFAFAADRALGAVAAGG